MVTIILPGGSIYNKKWLEEVAKNIGVDGEIRPIYWDHWENPEKPFDKKEKARLINSVAGMRVVNIIAKSIGTLVASYIIQQSPEKMNKVILNGIPLNDIDTEAKEVIKSALKLVSPEKIICFQNDKDPHGTFEQVKTFLGEVNPKIKVIPKTRSDHEYFYTDEFRSYLIS